MMIRDLPRGRLSSVLLILCVVPAKSLREDPREDRVPGGLTHLGNVWTKPKIVKAPMATASEAFAAAQESDGKSLIRNAGVLAKPLGRHQYQQGEGFEVHARTNKDDRPPIEEQTEHKCQESQDHEAVCLSETFSSFKGNKNGTMKSRDVKGHPNRYLLMAPGFRLSKEGRVPEYEGFPSIPGGRIPGRVLLRGSRYSPSTEDGRSSGCCRPKGKSGP